jgi:hypothetical protein
MSNVSNPYSIRCGKGFLALGGLRRHAAMRAASKYMHFAEWSPASPALKQ